MAKGNKKSALESMEYNTDVLSQLILDGFRSGRYLLQLRPDDKTGLPFIFKKRKGKKISPQFISNYGISAFCCMSAVD